ncbi:MAG: 2OG-Fe(II) oxygenase, partial [Gammaproteobacteria bacterium]
MPQIEQSITPLKTIKEVKPNTFIYEQHNALDKSLCTEMIQRFEKHAEEQYAGRLGQTVSQDQSIK